MADNGIKEGDEVSWNWGGGQPKGVAAEIKTEGKLEIESKGKLVHKNADPENPAVHVERDGNDVVKRASELHKLSSANGGDDDAKEKGALDNETKEKESKKEDKDERNKEPEVGKGVGASESKGDEAGETDAKEKPKSSSKRKKSDASARVGEKRTNGQSADEKEVDELEEEEQPKPKKRAKTTAKKGATGGGRGRGRGKGRGGKTSQPEQASEAKEKDAHGSESKMEVDENNQGNKADIVAKDSEQPASKEQPNQFATEPDGEDTPAANTRAKQ